MVHHGCYRILQGELHLQPGEFPGFCRVFAGIGSKTCGDRDNRVVHDIVRVLREPVQILLHLLFHLLQDFRGDLDRGEFQGARTDAVTLVTYVALNRDDGLRYQAAPVCRELPGPDASGFPVIDNG